MECGEKCFEKRWLGSNRQDPEVKKHNMKCTHLVWVELEFKGRITDQALPRRAQSVARLHDKKSPKPTVGASGSVQARIHDGSGTRG